jgi:hypothetical protein
MRTPMILVVDADAQNLEWERTFLEESLEDGALMCRGPSGDKHCPVLVGVDCPLVHAADGILFELDLDKEDSRRVLQRYTETLDVPTRVVATPDSYVGTSRC